MIVIENLFLFVWKTQNSLGIKRKKSIKKRGDTQTDRKQTKRRKRDVNFTFFVKKNAKYFEA